VPLSDGQTASQLSPDIRDDREAAAQYDDDDRDADDEIGPASAINTRLCSLDSASMLQSQLDMVKHAGTTNVRPDGAGATIASKCLHFGARRDEGPSPSSALYYEHS
jgi:hypothetical protein